LSIIQSLICLRHLFKVRSVLLMINLFVKLGFVIWLYCQAVNAEIVYLIPDNTSNYKLGTVLTEPVNRGKTKLQDATGSAHLFEVIGTVSDSPENKGITETLREIISSGDISQFAITTTIQIVIVLILFAIILLSYLIYLYRHPLVQCLSKEPEQLLKIPLEQLFKAKQLLKHTFYLKAVLAKTHVDMTWLDNAIKFSNMPNSKRYAVLANRLGATATDETAISEPDVFKLNLGDNFPLNLNKCLLYFPPGNLPIQEIIMRLQQGEMAVRATLVMSFDSEQQSALRSEGENPSTPIVVPNSGELTTLLLSPESINAFVTLLASQLKITQISPYQVTEGVNKDTLFFGRIQTLAQIMNREPANYLLIGGRQVGKSSVLKYIARRYQNYPKVDCHYLVLTSERLQPKLAQALGLPFKTDLETLLEKLANVPNGQYRLLLIDEADLFIRQQIKNGYPIIRDFRSLSEEGRCFFIFAGFWDLYEAALLDYHSPLKNFGEPITIGALEAEACRKLATKPMATLGIRYASDELVEQIVEATGQRANLIAIVCDEMLKNLDKRVLNQEDVTRALHSQAVQGALVGWQRLSEDKQAARLDRIIVCATVEAGEFSLSDIMQVLDEHHYDYSTEQLTQSLARLELAFIIKRDKDRYRYCVPLFRERLLEQDVTALLKQELKSVKSVR
jgi:hypothetical protein